MEAHLDALAEDPNRPERAERIKALVDAPQPMRELLLRRRMASDRQGPAGGPARGPRPALVPHPPIRDLQVVEVEGIMLCHADYDFEGRSIHVVLAFTPFSDISAVGRAVAAHMADVDPSRNPVVDVMTWRPDSHPSGDELSAAIAAQRGRMGPRPTDLAPGRDGVQPGRRHRPGEPDPVLHVPHRRGRAPGRGPLLPQPAPDAGQAPRAVAPGELRPDPAALHGGRLPVPRRGPRQPEGPSAVRPGRGARHDGRPRLARRPARATRRSSGWACRRSSRCAAPAPPSRSGVAPRPTGSRCSCARPGPCPRSTGRTSPS